MPRTRYTRFVHKLDGLQIAHQEKKLIALTQQLRSGDAGPIEIAPIVSAKERRRASLERQRIRNGKAPSSQPDQSQHAIAPTQKGDYR